MRFVLFCCLWLVLMLFLGCCVVCIVRWCLWCLFYCSVLGLVDFGRLERGELFDTCWFSCGWCIGDLVLVLVLLLFAFGLVRVF